MGREIAESVPEAMDVFRRGSEASGLDLERLCFEAPLDELVRTDVQQPALVATSLAVLAALNARGLHPDFVVGHSVGEFTALAAASSLDVAESIALVRERGLAMDEAARESNGSMAAILGLDDPVVEELCSEIEGVWPANYNCPGQIVVSGTQAAVDELCAAGRSGRRAAHREAQGLRCVSQSPGGARGRSAAARAGARPLQGSRGAVHVDGHRQDRACAQDGDAARRAAHRAGEVHAGRARADRGRRTRSSSRSARAMCSQVS